MKRPRCPAPRVPTAGTSLVLSSLEYALASREVEPGTLIHHADHGCQYTSIKLTNFGAAQSSRG
ncbi:hypothetical protein GCM10010349_79640 [Streptomyces flavofungini]|nr:hypothetical protein GCM10010349_79640 [Streptomyces flavofungini]